MDWQLILSVSLTTAFGPQAVVLRAGRHRPQPPLRLHRPRQLRPGRLRRRRRLHASPWASTPSACRSGSACSSSLVTASVLALILGVPDAAAARRLPRHRHDRGRRDHPAASLRAARFRDDDRRRGRHPELRRRLLRPQPVLRRHVRARHPRHRHRRRRTRANQIWVLLVGWTIVALACLLVYLLVRSPWGRVAEGDPRGRGRRAQPRQERLRLQAAVARRRRRDRRHRRHASSPSARQSVVPDSLGTALTFFAYVALVLGGAARVLGPGARRRSSSSSSARSSTSPSAQAIEADHINFLVGQRGRHRPAASSSASA